MNPRLVREGVCPDDSLVRLHHHARHGGHELGRLDDLLRFDIGQGGVRQHGAVEGRVVVRLTAIRSTGEVTGDSSGTQVQSVEGP